MPSVEDFIVDFSKEEESGGSRPKLKEGTFKAKVLSAKTGISENKSSPYLEVTFLILEGPNKKKKLPERLYNTPKAMRRYRILLQALGLKVPKKLNLVKVAKAIKGKELYIEIENEPAREGYDERSRVAFEGFINVDDYDPNADEDEEEDEDEDLEEEDEDEDLEEEDEDEEDEDEEDEEDEDEDEDDDLEEEDEEDEEEEEEPAPKRRKKSAAKKAPAKAKKAPAKKKRKSKKAEDDLDDLDLDDL